MLDAYTDYLEETNTRIDAIEETNSDEQDRLRGIIDAAAEALGITPEMFCRGDFSFGEASLLGDPVFDSSFIGEGDNQSPVVGSPILHGHDRSRRESGAFRVDELSQDGATSVPRRTVTPPV